MQQKLICRDITLGEKQVRLQVSLYNGVNYLSIRYMYTNPAGELCYGKNGINIPLEDAAEAIVLLEALYYDSTGKSPIDEYRGFVPDVVP